jgi:phage terminase large subunit-like protein
VLTAGADVYAGLDGAKKHDYGAFALCEPRFREGDPAPVFHVTARMFRAQDSETSIVRRMKHSLLRADRRFRIHEAHYDPHYLTETADDLDEQGIEMVEFPQTPGRMSVNTNLFRELVEEGRIVHDADPELARHVSAAVTVETGENSWRVSKKRSREKIDGLIAVMLAVEAAYRAWQRGDVGPNSGVQIIGG